MSSSAKPVGRVAELRRYPVKSMAAEPLESVGLGWHGLEDPEAYRRRPGLLRTIARERSACLGVYGTSITPGRMSVGDPVYLG